LSGHFSIGKDYSRTGGERSKERNSTRSNPLIERCDMHYVIEASYLGGYRLKIRFENQEVRVVDLSDHLDGPVFEPLKDLAYFKQFKVNQDIDTVVWPNDADFSPDFLYQIGEPVSEPPRADAAAERLG
jgi:hypothetical protein